MTHPMRPTAEQLNEWLAAALEAHPNGRVALIAGHVAHQAYAAGADDELEECAELLRTGFPGSLHGARRPLDGTVAANVLQWGTGGLNVDGCRVGTSKDVPASVSKKAPANCYGKFAEGGESPGVGGHDPNLGRWPANLIHDGSDEVVRLFPQTTPSPTGPVKQGGGSGYKPGDKYGAAREGFGVGYGDSRSAARFFYCAKASRKDRGAGNNHPTVKPTDLMRYLCRLVTPPGGIVLDPFMGSGSTGKAAMLEGFKFIGIEREVSYFSIAESRIEEAANRPKQTLIF